MGDTHAVGMGYGVVYENSTSLEEKLEEAIDIEFLLEDEYPMLVTHSSGNAWKNSSVQMIFIKSTTHYDYSFLIETEDLNTTIPETGLHQLRNFCLTFNLPFEPSWKIFSYLG